MGDGKQVRGERWRRIAGNYSLSRCELKLIFLLVGITVIKFNIAKASCVSLYSVCVPFQNEQKQKVVGRKRQRKQVQQIGWYLSLGALIFHLLSPGERRLFFFSSLIQVVIHYFTVLSQIMYPLLFSPVNISVQEDLFLLCANLTLYDLCSKDSVPRFYKKGLDLWDFWGRSPLYYLKIFYIYTL